MMVKPYSKKREEKEINRNLDFIKCTRQLKKANEMHGQTKYYCHNKEKAIW